MISKSSPEKIKLLSTVFWLLLVVYILYLSHDLFFGDTDQPDRYLWTIFAIFLLMLPFAFEKRIGMYVPWEIKIIAVLSLLLHTMGEFHRWYYTLTHFDKITHIVSAIGVAYLVFLFLILFGLYYGPGWKKERVMFFIILLTMSFAFFWEGWEIFSDHYFGSKFFWNFQDGVGDTIANSIGAIIVAWSAGSYLENRSDKEIANDFILQDGNGRYKIQWEIFPGKSELHKVQDQKLPENMIAGDERISISMPKSPHARER